MSSHGGSTGGLEWGKAGQEGGEGVGLLVCCLKERDELFHFFGNQRILGSRWSRLLSCSVRSPARKAQLVGRL